MKKGKHKKTTNKSRDVSGHGSSRPHNQSVFTSKEMSSDSSKMDIRKNKEEENDSCFDIPGFYFDKEKKKYFKILPGQHHPTSSSFVTRESVKTKETEVTRQRDLKFLSCKRKINKVKLIHTSNTPQSTFVRCKGLISLKQKVPSSTSLFEAINKTPYGMLSTFQFKNRMRHIVIENLKPTAFSKVFHSPCHSYERLEHMQKMVPSTTNPNHMICVWSLKEILVQRIQTLAVKSVQQTHESGCDLNVAVTGAMIPKAVSKITSLCSAPLKLKNNTDEYVLYTTMCLIGNNPSLVMIRNLNCTDASDFRFSEFNLSSKATWCCAWNCEKEYFSVGSEKCGLLIDVETRSMWELNSQNSDVLSQDFVKSGKLLYSGTRQGSVLGHDLRSKSTHQILKLNHKVGVCSLRTLSNGNYLVASDFNNKIKNWDLRQMKVVTEYSGHKNQHSIIPLHVSEQLDLVYSAGQDCYSRVWSLQSGELLKVIPPPHPASITTIPTLHYSDCVDGRPGLLLGMLDQVHFYSIGQALP